jgi:cell division protein FtsW
MEFNFLGRAFKGDKVIWCIFIALCIISLLEVFSATSTIAYRQQSHWAPILRHSAFLLIGFAVVMFLQRIPSRFFSILLLGLPISAILLVITMFMGEDVNGAQRWLGIGAFTIQPSEFAKISAIGFVAFFLSKMKPDNESWIFKTLIIGVALLCLLIAPENLSTACLLFGVCFLMMFIGQVSIKKLGTVALIGIAGIVLLLGSLTMLPEDIADKYLPGRLATWKNRIERHSGEGKTSINDVNEDGSIAYKITDENYQVSHAKIAIANGGVIPAALLNQRLNIEIQLLKLSLRDAEQRQMYDTPRLVEELKFNVEGKTILLVEDRVKTGTTLNYAKKLLSEAGAKTIKTFAVNGNADYALYNEACFRFPWLI